jgi:N6-adenosine-specific RNA methylase IME4
MPLPRATAGVILADVPWNFVTWSALGHRKSAHAKYHCMSHGDVLALPVAELAAPDSVLVPRVPRNQVEQTYAVARAWGRPPQR